VRYLAIPTCTGAAGVAAKVDLTIPALRAMVATAAYLVLANSGDANA
jgi:hypothetical protein